MLYYNYYIKILLLITYYYLFQLFETHLYYKTNAKATSTFHLLTQQKLDNITVYLYYKAVH